MVGCAVLHGCTHSVAWAGHVYKSCTCVSISCRMSVPTLVSATHALANLKCTVGHTGIDAERAKSSELAGWRGSRRHRKAEGKRGLGLWTDAMRARSRSKVTVTLYRLPGKYGNPRLTPDPRARAPKKRKYGFISLSSTQATTRGTQATGRRVQFSGSWVLVVHRSVLKPEQT